MAFNINEFRGKLVGGGARPNLFQVIINTPAGAQVGLNSEQLAFMCKAASLPQSTINPIPLFYFGRPVHVAGERSFDPWDVTIINDETFDLRDAFERWHSAMSSYSTKNNAKTNLGATGNPSSYTVSGQILQYGKDGSIIKTVELANIFPITIGGIMLSWEETQQVEQFNVTFSIDYFTSDSAI